MLELNASAMPRCASSTVLIGDAFIQSVMTMKRGNFLHVEVTDSNKY